MHFLSARRPVRLKIIECEVKPLQITILFCFQYFLLRLRNLVPLCPSLSPSSFLLSNLPHILPSLFLNLFASSLPSIISSLLSSHLFFPSIFLSSPPSLPSIPPSSFGFPTLPSHSDSLPFPPYLPSLPVPYPHFSIGSSPKLI